MVKGWGGFMGGSMFESQWEQKIYPKKKKKKGILDGLEIIVIGQVLSFSM